MSCVLISLKMGERYPHPRGNEIFDIGVRGSKSRGFTASRSPHHTIGVSYALYNGSNDRNIPPKSLFE